VVDVPSIVSGTGQGTRVADAGIVVVGGIQGRPTPGVIADEVLAVAADQQGGVWAATMSGLSRFDGHGWVSYTRAEGLLDDRFYGCLTVDRDGGVWAGGSGGVTHFDGQRWTHYDAIRGSHAMASAPNGDIWVLGGQLTAYRFDGADWWRYGPEDGLIGHPQLTTGRVAVDRSGVVWIGYCYGEFTGGPTYNMASFDGHQWVLYDLPEPGVIQNAYGIYADSANRLWVGTDHGLVVRDTAGWRLYANPPFGYTTALTEDPNGRLWVCGNGEVGVLQGTRWTSVAVETDPEAIAIDGRGDVWVADPFMGGVARWAEADLPTAVRSDLGSSEPVPTEGLGAAPNPFNQQVEVRFTLHRPADIRLQVFDSLGQPVTTLAEGYYPVGAHTVVWNARAGGHDLASGVYLCRLAGPGQPLVRRLLLLR
jgi:hypothetical protein